MQLTYTGLQQLLANAVIEVRFKRRHEKPGAAPWRRMLCTNSPKILKSLPGRVSLFYKDPKGVGLRFIPQQKNLMPTWDIFWQDFRLISLDAYDIVSVIPANTEEDLIKWWAYFNVVLLELSPQDKQAFMNI